MRKNNLQKQYDKYLLPAIMIIIGLFLTKRRETRWENIFSSASLTKSKGCSCDNPDTNTKPVQKNSFYVVNDEALERATDFNIQNQGDLSEAFRVIMQNQ